MNRTTVLALGAILLGKIACAANSSSIAVFVDFETEPSIQSISQMKTEIADILQPSGLALDWHNLTGRNDLESFPDLVVVRFQGSCQVRNPAMDSELGPSLPTNALATTAVSDGQVLPFSSVRCDEIRKYLALELATASPSNRDAIYGKALGRIVAHELYHVFASTTHHARVGVAHETHSRADLTQAKFRFSAEETALLREHKIKALLAGEAQRVGW